MVAEGEQGRRIVHLRERLAAPFLGYEFSKTLFPVASGSAFGDSFLQLDRGGGRLPTLTAPRNAFSANLDRTLIVTANRMEALELGPRLQIRRVSLEAPAQKLPCPIVFPE